MLRCGIWQNSKAATPSVRATLDQWFRTSDSFEQANRRSALGLRAAGELNPDIRQRLIAEAVELALRLAEAMEKESDTRQLSVLGGTLAALAAQLEPIQAAPIVVRAVNRLAEAMEKESGAYRLSSLGSALGKLAGRLEPAQAAPITSCLAEMVEKETKADRLSILGDTLAALAGRLEPAHAAPSPPEPPSGGGDGKGKRRCRAQRSGRLARDAV